MGEREKVDFERLADWVEGRLPEDEAAAVAEQVEGADEETRAQVEWLRAFTRASAETVLAPPPDDVRDFLSRSFANRAAEVRAREAREREAQEPGLLRRIVATLSFDSGLQAAAAGARTAGAEEEQRQLAFTTDTAEVVLDVMPRPGGRTLDLGGQVFPAGDEGPEGFTVKLLRDGEEVGATTTDDLGEFAFEEIPYGPYELLLDAGKFEVLIPRFELSP